MLEGVAPDSIPSVHSHWPLSLVLYFGPEGAINSAWCFIANGALHPLGVCRAQKKSSLALGMALGH